MKLSIVAVSLALLMGCAGTNFSYDKARQVKVGMTEAELVALMGRPYSVMSRDGSQLWVWSHANGFSGSSRAISFELRDGRVASVPDIPSSFR